MSFSYTNAQCVGYLAAWYAYGTTNIETIKTTAFYAGQLLSVRVAAFIPGWDFIIEPMIISQCARLFVCVHHFVQGLTSDNTNVVDVNRAFTDMKRTILDDFDARVI
jgi:hypothetical protein